MPVRQRENTAIQGHPEFAWTHSDGFIGWDFSIPKTSAMYLKEHFVKNVQLYNNLKQRRNNNKNMWMHPDGTTWVCMWLPLGLACVSLVVLGDRCFSLSLLRLEIYLYFYFYVFPNLDFSFALGYKFHKAMLWQFCVANIYSHASVNLYSPPSSFFNSIFMFMLGLFFLYPIEITNIFLFSYKFLD